jgi:hypothetical protein
MKTILDATNLLLSTERAGGSYKRAHSSSSPPTWAVCVLQNIVLLIDVMVMQQYNA